jgi:hypothetical protein
MKNRIITGISFIILGVLIAIGPLYIFKVCSPMGKEVMKCFYTAKAEIGVGSLIAILGILLFVFKSTQTRFGISISITLAGVLAGLIPTVFIGVCGMSAMHCHMVTLPAIIVLSILTIVGSIINAIYLFSLIKRDHLTL